MNYDDEDALARRVETFLYDEIALVDERKFEEWLTLFSEDVRYFVPVRTIQNLQGRDREFSRDNELAHVDDNLEGLKMRVRRLQTGFSWAEDPPSRTRHFITNIRVKRLEQGEIEATCNLLVYRGRSDRQQDIFSAKRVDRLKSHADKTGFAISARTIYLDHTLLLTSGISIFL
jgi:biphenyl 2,3-dioxygenase beta subunit